MKNFTILYVEDDIDTQELLSLRFKDEVKEFYQAYNGKEGLEMFRKYKPDIILTDLNMPVSNGLEMAQKIKDLNQNQTIFILAAFDNKQALSDAISLGIKYFIPKPIDIDNLILKLKQISKTL